MRRKSPAPRTKVIKIAYTEQNNRVQTGLIRASRRLLLVLLPLLRFQWSNELRVLPGKNYSIHSYFIKMPYFTVTIMLRIDNFQAQCPLPTLCQFVECKVDPESVTAAMLQNEKLVCEILPACTYFDRNRTWSFTSPSLLLISLACSMFFKRAAM